MNELEATLTMEYIDEHLFEPTRTWPKHLFEERTYARWAAYEIVRRFMDHPFDPPDLIVESFMLEMINYSRISTNPEAARIFEIAQDTAEDILCLLS